MRLLTTTIGAYPKPDYLKLPDWFNIPDGPDTAKPTADWNGAMQTMGHEANETIARAVHDAVKDQVSAGIDIPTDGEIPRENYIHYHCRHLDGFDFENLVEKEVRGGTYSASLPAVRGKISPSSVGFLVADWKVAQAATDRPVKMTLPGPMTIADTTSNVYYQDAVQEGRDLADALNREVRALVEAGCKHIQIDEPVMARQVDNALAYGIANLERAFHGCPASVTRTVHACCGYPDRLDHANYPKAPQEAYGELASAIDDCKAILAISIEDAHRPNDLALLKHFIQTKVVLGVVAIAKSQVETVDEIRARLKDALKHIDGDRLIAAPDCGLGLLGRELALKKLRALSEAARHVHAQDV